MNLAIGTVDLGDFQPSVVSVPVEPCAGPNEVALIIQGDLGHVSDSILIALNDEDLSYAGHGD